MYLKINYNSLDIKDLHPSMLYIYIQINFKEFHKKLTTKIKLTKPMSKASSTEQMVRKIITPATDTKNMGQLDKLILLSLNKLTVVVEIEVYYFSLKVNR